MARSRIPSGPARSMLFSTRSISAIVRAGRGSVRSARGISIVAPGSCSRCPRLASQRKNTIVHPSVLRLAVQRAAVLAPEMEEPLLVALDRRLRDLDGARDAALGAPGDEAV